MPDSRYVFRAFYFFHVIETECRYLNIFSSLFFRPQVFCWNFAVKILFLSRVIYEFVRKTTFFKIARNFFKSIVVYFIVITIISTCKLFTTVE